MGDMTMNDRFQRLIGLVELERNNCIRRREEKAELRDAIAAAGWDGKVQGLNMALAILREPNAGSDEDGYMVCPFCGDTDYDLLGLKHHLQHTCGGWEKTPPVNFVRTRAG